MGRFSGIRPINRRAFVRALSRLEEEAEESGRSLREQLLLAVGEFEAAQRTKPDTTAARIRHLPIEFLRELLNFSAGRSKRTPGQQVKKVLKPWSLDQKPQHFQEWYRQFYGEFAQGVLSEVMRDILVFATKNEAPLIQRVREAIMSGDVKSFEQIARCVALIHGLRYEGTGQASRVASHNKKRIGFSYLHLYELEDKPPTPADIRVDIARDICLNQRSGRPKFSDIWYLLRSGSIGDEDDRGPNSRYEVVGTRYIKKVLKSLKWPFRASPHGLITVEAVRRILDRTGMDYLDDSKTVLRK